MAVFLSQDNATAQENVVKILVKKMLASAKLPLTKAVSIMNELYPDNATTPQNINNKLTAESVKFIEVVRLAEICGYQVIFRPVGAPEAEATPAKSAPHRIPKEKDPEEDKPVKAEPEKKIAKDSFASLAAQGYASCRSINFNALVIAGKNAEQAAAWIEKNLVDGMTDVQEIVLYLAANRDFHVIAKPIESDGQFTLF